MYFVIQHWKVQQFTHLEDNVSVSLLTKQSFPCYNSHHSRWQIHYFLLCSLRYSPFTNATYPSSNSCSRFSATFVRNSGVHTSWLYERLSCFRVGHLRYGSKAKEGPMSFREISRFAIQFIFSKYVGKEVNRLLCKSKYVKHFKFWKKRIICFLKVKRKYEFIDFKLSYIL